MMREEPATQMVPRYRLVAPLRRTNSGSATFLGVASDGRHYWIKAPNNPQGARTLIPELITYQLGRLIAAPVPETALIDIPSGFDWQLAPGTRLLGGVGHGSLNLEPVVESDEWGEFANRDENRSRQAGIVALWDLCLGEDPQWLHTTRDDMSIWTFDHGLWFGGGADWSLDALRKVGDRPWDGLEPGIASANALNSVADRVRDLDVNSFRAVTSSVPLEWETSPAELSELATILSRRVPGVAERLRIAAAHTRFRD